MVHVPKTSVSVTSVDDVVAASTSTVAALQATSVQVSYEVGFIAETAGFTNGVLAFTAVSEKLKTSISDGTFNDQLTQSGHSKLTSVSSRPAGISTPRYVIVRSASPTLAPSVGNNANNVVASGYESLGTTYQVILWVGIAVVFLLITGCIMYYRWRIAKNSSDGNENSEKNAAASSRRQNGNVKK